MKPKKANKERVLLITGCTGYLAQLFIDRMIDKKIFSRIIGIDVKDPDPDWLLKRFSKFTFHHCDVRDRERVDSIFMKVRPDVVLHLAWIFNPTHDKKMEYEVDVIGSQNIFNAALSLKVLGLRKIVYVSSTTTYVGAHNTSDPPFPKEESAVSSNTRYLYTKYKAVVERYVQSLVKLNPEVSFTILRAPIVIGPHTKNIVTQMADWSLSGFENKMFKVSGADPPMQFLSEEDFAEILLRAVVQEHPGIYNIAGEGTIRYEDVIKRLSKSPFSLPAFMLYPITWILWNLDMCPFPAGILDLIRYPWVGDITKLKEEFGYVPKKSSQEAFDEFARSRQII